jgi:hypothetical protein
MLDIHKLKEKPMTTKKTYIVISSKCLEFPNWKKNQFKILFGPKLITIILQFKFLFGPKLITIILQFKFLFGPKLITIILQFKILFGPKLITIILQFKIMILKITKSLCNPSENFMQGPFVNNKHHLKHGSPSQ